MVRTRHLGSIRHVAQLFQTLHAAGAYVVLAAGTRLRKNARRPTGTRCPRASVGSKRRAAWDRKSRTSEDASVRWLTRRRADLRDLYSLHSSCLLCSVCRKGFRLREPNMLISFRFLKGMSECRNHTLLEQEVVVQIPPSPRPVFSSGWPLRSTLWTWFVSCFVS